MMGIANQLLAAIALTVGTTYLLVHAPKRAYALCTGVPLVFVVATVFTAGVLRVQAWWQELADPTGSLDPAKKFSLKLMCALACIMLVLTTLIVASALRRWIAILSRPAVSARVTAVAGQPPAGT
jgi:carbon starvation protein